MLVRLMLYSTYCFFRLGFSQVSMVSVLRHNLLFTPNNPCVVSSNNTIHFFVFKVFNIVYFMVAAFVMGYSFPATVS